MFHNIACRRARTRAQHCARGIIGSLVIMMWAWAAPQAAAATQRPALASTVINGSTVYSAADLFGAYREQLGHPITSASAQAIAAALVDLYLRDGYARPVLRIDDALVARGILRIEVFEPQITRVSVSGNAGPHRERLERIADELRASRPLRRNGLQQALRAMRRLPGLTVTATTRRDARARNGHELLVQADFAPVEGVLRVNNRGTEQAGRNFVLGQIVANGAFGREEKLGLLLAAATDTEEYRGAGLFLDAPVAASGTRALAMAFRSQSAPNESPVNLPDEYTRERATFRITHPWQRHADWNLALSAALEAEDLTIDRDGRDVRNDRLRIIEAGARVAWQSSVATQYAATIELRQGLDGFGSGLRAADLASDRRRSDFLVLQVQLSRLARVSEVWSLRLDALAQRSGYVLPDSERFKIGGDRLGRGFEVAEIAGDSGAGAKLELRRELTRSGSFLGRTSAYGFYDLGAAWKQDREGRESAATAGTGVAMHGTRLTGYLEIAKPLTHPDVEGKRDTTVFAELSFRF